MFVKTGTTVLQALLLACIFALVQPGGASANPIINNSFEDGLNDWVNNADGRFGRNAEPSAYDGLPTDGSTSGRIFSQTWSTFTAGQYGSLSQTVDLSGIGSITFDAVLRQIGLDSEGVWSPFLEAAFVIDGVDLWTANSIGTYFDRTIDMSAFTGLHRIEFRLRAAADSGSVGHISNWFLFDNLRTTVAVPEPASLALLGAGLGAISIMTRRRRKAT